jgi:flagellar basal body-associated protein FliL
MCKITGVEWWNLQVMAGRNTQRGKTLVSLPKFSQSTRYFYISHNDPVCMNSKLLILIIICIAVAATAGCMGIPSTALSKSSVSQEASSVYTSANPVRIQSDATTFSATGKSVPAPVPTSAPSAPGTDIDTKIVKTAYITLEVKDVPGSVDTLKTMVTAKGGYLSSSSIQEAYNNQLSGTVVLRIPQAEFENTLAGVKAIGIVKSVSAQGEDVTEAYVDIQAQKNSYQNQLAQYNEIMKKAVKVSDVIEIQQQIDRVQTELNRLEGRQKYLDSRIDMSTITVTLQEPEPVGGESGHSFVTSVNEGIAGFFGMIDAIIIILLTLLPIILIGGFGYGIYRWKKGKQPEKVPAQLTEKK